jgi:hypothetical protein
MKFPLFSLMNKSLAARTLIFLMCVAAMAISASAQKTFQRTLSPEAVALNIEQCANGPVAAPITCSVATANDGYVRGNLIASKSHYLEGDFVPIRVVAEGITTGQPYTITVGYDYTKGGKYATDYLGDYDETESVNNNPCVGVTGCVLASRQDFPITPDPQVAAGFDGVPSGDDITQIAGSISCFGCTISGVSVATLVADTTGDSSKLVTISFTANQANMVIAYGSHISTRSDWGLSHSAVNISGSPYHNFVSATTIPDTNNGNRDLQLSAEAVIFPANIIIEKTVVNFFLQTSGGQSFGFTSSAAIFPASTTFSLVDNVAEPFTNTLANREGGEITSANITSFGSGNLITVSEDTPPSTWSLVANGITCTSINGTNNNTFNFGTRTVSIQLEEGELVNCKFHNSQLAPSAAPATISGRAVNSLGGGIGGARITVTDAQSGATFVAITNPFGYYTIEGTEVENFYIMTISHKQYTFADDTRSFTLHDNLTGVDFVANP